MLLPWNSTVDNSKRTSSRPKSGTVFQYVKWYASLPEELKGNSFVKEAGNGTLVWVVFPSPVAVSAEMEALVKAAQAVAAIAEKFSSNK